MDETHEKLYRLKEDLASMGSVAIAFSSGVDSTFLLKAAHDVLGSRVIAVTAKSCSFPQRELLEAQAFCQIKYMTRGRFVCKTRNDLASISAHKRPPERRSYMPPSVSPINWTGNKSCIYETISAFMPPHRVYIEPCMGSAEVFLRKRPAEKEIINDYNGDLVNFFRVLRSKKSLPQLLGRLYSCHSRD